MEINSLLAGCASGFGAGYIDLLMLRSASRNILQGGNSQVYRVVIASLMVRLLLVGALFYLFLAVLGVGVAGFLSGLVMSSAMAFLQAVRGQQKLMEKTHVGNS